MRRKFLLFLPLLIMMTLVIVGFIVSAADNDVSNVLDLGSGDGMVFDGLSLYTTKDREGNEICVTEIPVTYEAWIKMPAGYNKEQGDIYANYSSVDENGVRFRGFSYGRPYLYLKPTDDGTTCSFYFSGSNLANNEWTHLTIVDDTESGEVRCYINGELAGTQTMTDAQKATSRDVSQRPMCLGGSYLTDTSPFIGSIRSVVVYDDVRTADEIKEDMKYVDLNDKNLISAYDLNNKKGAEVIEDATGQYDMVNNRATNDWVSPEQLSDLGEYDYSIALIGDTQVISAHYPQLYHTYFDWLIENKEEHKIQHVLNLGDMTNFNYDWEWDNVRNEWFRLNGEVDYTLVRGDHDVLNDNNADTDYDKNKYDIWFNVDEYKIGKFIDEKGDPIADSGYYTESDGSFTNTYRALKIGNVDYLIVTVDKYPSEDVMSWVDSVVTDEKYENHRVIMTMHCYIDADGTYLDEGSKMIGDDFWEKIKDYSNLHMVISGHVYAWGITWNKAEGTNGNVVNQIVVNPQGPDFDQSGPTAMIAMLYFSNNGNDVEVRYYSPVLNKYYVGNHNEVEGTYHLDSSAFSIKTDDFSAAEQITEFLPKNDSEGEAPEENVTENPTVTYGEGDDFEAKFEEALKLAEKSNVNFVMSTDYTANQTVVLGSEIMIPQYTVKVTSENSSVVELGTGGFNLIFWGNVEFDNVKISGNGKSSANMLFCPDGCSIKIGSNVTTGSSRANIAGDSIEINSGDWRIVCAMIDYSVIDGYIDRTEKDTKPYKRAIFISDPEITLRGTAVAYDVFGGAYTNGRSYNKDDCTFAVIGKATVNILESATVENFAAASGKAEYTTHDGVINVNTDGTVSRLCAAVGPVGRGDEFNHIYYPNLTLNIDKVGGEDGGSFMGVWMYTTGKKDSGKITYINNRANTTINVNGGKFKSSTSYGGFVVNSSGIVYVNNYGKNTLNVNGGSFLGEVFGGGLFNAEYGVDYADVEVNINDGEFTNNVYGSSRILKSNCSNSGETTLTIKSGSFASIRGGSYFAKAADNSIHGKNTTTVIDGGKYSSNIYGGSYILGGSAYKEHSGNSLLEIKSGTFATNTSVYGSCYMADNYIKITGDIRLDIYGGVTLSADVFGGAFSNGTNGSEFALSSGDGNLISGDIVFNIYGKDKNGENSSAVISKSIYAGSYLNNGWSQMSGDITYNFAGVKLAHASSGGCLLSGDSAKMSGSISGTLDNVTFGGTFYGASTLSGDYAIQSGDSTLILVDTNVVSKLSAGPCIKNNVSTDFSGLSTLVYKSGYVSANGLAIGGCYFSVPNVKITGSSKVIFGERSEAADTTPYVKEGGKLIGGSYGNSTAFTTDGNASEWGMYGSSDVIMNNGEIKEGGYIIGGSYIASTDTPTSTVDWDKYPVVGGTADSSKNKNHTKVTINGGTVNGPRIYAGSYLKDGGLDYGTVELEVNGGTITMTSGILNYNTDRDTGSLYPATYYPSETAKALNCNYVLTLNGGKYNFPKKENTSASATVGISGGMAVYGGGVTGNATLNLNVNTQETTNFLYKPSHIVGGMVNVHKKLVGDTTLNVGPSGTINSSGIVTAGCTGWWNAADVSGDGIYRGFWHEGDVYFNYSGGKSTRLIYATGYKCNVDGNAYINISSGTFNQNIYGTAGYATATEYSSITGDVVWNISGGTFNKAVYGGGNATSTYCPANEYNVIGGRIYAEITGGTFNEVFYLGGKNGVLADKEARVKFVGDKFAIGENGGVAAYETVDGVTIVGTYTLDLLQSGVAISGTDFSKTINQLSNAEIKFTDMFGQGIKFELRDSIAEVIEDSKITIEDSTYTYAELIAFDSYSKSPNEFKFYSAEQDKEIKTVGTATYDIYIMSGLVKSATIFMNNISLEAAIKETEENFELVGNSMRIIGGLGLRLRMAVDRSYLSNHSDKTLGYMINEMGILVAADDIYATEALEINGSGVVAAKVIVNGKVNFETMNNNCWMTDETKYPGQNLFAAVVSNYNSTRYARNIYFRPYVICEDTNGDTFVLYRDMSQYASDDPSQTTASGSSIIVGEGFSCYKTSLGIRAKYEQDNNTDFYNTTNDSVVYSEKIDEIVEVCYSE